MTKQARSAVITFTVDINTDSIRELLKALEAAAEKRVKTCHLLLATVGGNTDAGLIGYNMLRAMPFRVVTHNIGNVDSMGTTLYLAGDDRRACSSSRFMIHEGTNTMSGNFNRAALEAGLESLDLANLRLIDILCERSGCDREIAAKWYASSQTLLTAREAQDCGIVHEIRDAKRPKPHDFVQAITQTSGGGFSYTIK